MAAASLVTLLVTAIEIFSVMMPTLVSLAMMLSAVMAFSVVMPAFVSYTVVMAVVITLGVRVILQRPLRQCLGCCIS